MMNKFAFILAAAAAFSYVDASEAKQERYERQAWRSAVTSVHLPVGPVPEGRQMTAIHRVETRPAQPVHAHRIEINARSSRTER
ncbi:hypothetical protein MKI84_02460 [Ancylobacter sp. A5.8]|uniref:hypothetical protein n=1 Tax=Ancylobacter gelatini TaxID=2919920 RepID=UPI001F4D41A2|nr:hypothetical protein [Ancylobacter gelatini]MCJ8141769.1 hypothetical protein [Ancylobacter gelatini]